MVQGAWVTFGVLGGSNWLVGLVEWIAVVILNPYEVVTSTIYYQLDINEQWLEILSSHCFLLSTQLAIILPFVLLTLIVKH